jgi:hypothetical protein
MRDLQALLAAAVIAAFAGSAHADNVITGMENAALFGNLNQGDTACPNVACGPTAAVNSFVYLQNRWPNKYDNKLVPKGANAAQQYMNMQMVANTLGSAAYMNTCACGNGTFIEQFILGKQKYLDTKAGMVTSYGAQDTFAWRTTLPDGSMVAAKPAYVQDNTAPTGQWLVDQLQAGEDVELFINGSMGNHYITLTQMTYNLTNNTGSFMFIDPNQVNNMMAGPPVVSMGMITGLDATDSDILFTSASVSAYLGTGLNIVNAVSESPVPEPATYAVMGIGFLALGAVLRRRSRSPVGVAAT